MTHPPAATIVEVGPRDGLQNEATPIGTDDKVAFIDALSAAGQRVIEVSSFVSPKWVPQMADAADVFAGLTRRPGVRARQCDVGGGTSPRSCPSSSGPSTAMVDQRRRAGGAVRGHGRSRSTTCARSSSRSSRRCRAITCMPTGSPSIVPIGMLMLGFP